MTSYRIGQVEIDVEARQIVSAGETVALEPRAFDALVFLIENRDRVVSKDELIREVWRDRVVTDGAVSQSIAKIRRVFGGDTQSVISTTSRVGYRFAEDVEVLAPAALGPARGPRPAWLSRGALSALLIGLAAVVAWLALSGPSADVQVAVLPLAGAADDLSADDEVAGLTQILTEALTAGRGIRIVPADAVLKAVGAEGSASVETLERLSAVLGVNRLVGGNLHGSEGAYELELLLVSPDGESPKLVLVGSDPAALAEQAGRKALTQWRPSRLIDGERRLLSEDPLANENYRRGLDAMHRGDAPAARDLFQAALRIDPDFLRAGYQLALSIRDQGGYTEASTMFEDVTKRSLDSGDQRLEADAIHALALTRWRQQDYASAVDLEARSRAVLERLEDTLGIARSDVFLGILASRQSRFEEAATRYASALDGYQRTGYLPGQARTYNSLGVLAWRQFDVGTSEAMHRKALDIRLQLGQERDAAASLNNLGTIAAFRGQLDEARELYERALSVRSRLEDLPGQISSLWNLAEIDIDLGRLADAQDRLDEAESIASGLNDGERLAWIATSRGRIALAQHSRDVAVSHFQRALEINRDQGDRASVAGIEVAIAAALADDPVAEITTLLNDARDIASDLNLTDVLFQAHHVEARRALASGDLQGAREGLDALLGGKSRPNQRKLLVDTAILQLQVLLELGEPDAAQHLLPRIESWRDRYPPALLARACLSRAKGHPHEAERLAELATQMAGEAAPSFDNGLLACAGIRQEPDGVVPEGPSAAPQPGT